MNVLVVGGGGREHALAWKLKQSPRVEKLFVAPGNGGTQLVAENVPIPETDFQGLARFAHEKNINLTVVGGDEPLALGIVDYFKARGLRIWGPTKAAAQVESSKAFAKRLMHEAKIPTAAFEVHSDITGAMAYVRRQGFPIVIKASGLARGKGVYVCQTMAEAEQALKELMIDKVHGDAGNEVVLEEFLEGEEVSIHALSDGLNCILFPASQDHKRAGDGNTGKNTGGMGAIAPVPWITIEMMTAIELHIIRPMVDALAYRGTPFIGMLYAGLKIGSGEPKVLEWNARFGDPETQAYMPILKTDLLDLIEACLDGTIADTKIGWQFESAVSVVLASAGYPDDFQTGFPVYGINDAERNPNVIVFQGGTTFDGLQTKTAGGRVLSVTALGSPLQHAIDIAYEAVKKIDFKGMYYRHDIGASSLK